ncbi:DUF4249 family protein [Gracilimonas amylolytica]|uniref:DUF4249 family protein n=1 Tax=Gracilimonas amylolytica TaxID=1749045 RepID=UPI000CD8D8C9|nr:DUF4249 family protein [Gracilimonas amylolytica]
MKHFLFILLAFVLLVSACDPYAQDEYEEYYVVESYLVANALLPEVRLSTTVPADAFYDFEEAAVNDANIEIQLLESGAESSVEQSWSYRYDAPGIYVPEVDHNVIPGRTYKLDITLPATSEKITSTTTVPEAFQIIGAVPDSIFYQATDQLEFTLSASSYPGRQNIYVFNAVSLRPFSANLTPFYSELIAESDEPEQDLEELANNSSGIINESGFEFNPDGSATVQYPWIGIAFFEDNLIVANTIDDNVYDFIRSQETQLGGSTLSPGEIQNIIYNIEGGIGVFGALASDTVQVYIKRPGS